ncbi:hypothetical protein [Jannaschia seohaensis]|uniref:Uncharacterized protein n=1 Tax=Jannaschia seohaensis TaxID=475081 RepID=A0A2Y9A3U8_9RHOB|nr:hypothetical protein [Jannaschia seohaensis]PWJ21860.1 hypothetical protein BCF38_101268 [Jannaschia seohaensis]SSA38138.1 hypothetical protein SAMN05421539_101268 [Jannaschia seohaensis]
MSTPPPDADRPPLLGRLRRVAGFTLLITGALLLAGALLGSGGNSDIASELTHVTDAASHTAFATPRGPGPRVRATTGEGRCAIRAEAAPEPAARIALSMTAPCHARSRVDVVQGPLAVTTLLDDEGRGELILPALAEAPLIAVIVEDAEALTLQTWVTDFGLYERAVLQWGGGVGLGLHAFENDATWGDPGHVGPESPRDADYAMQGMGGFLTQLGDPSVSDGLGALVYTAPQGVRAALTLEAAVTSETCGQSIDAAAFRVGPGLDAEPRSVTMTVPGCQAVGDSVLIDGVLGSVGARD